MADKKTNLSIVVSAENKAEKALREISDSMNQYEKSTENLNKSFGGMAKYGGMAFAAISGAVIASTKLFADAGDALGEMSTKTGISVQSLSELKYALEQSDSNIETFETGITQMSKFMSELKGGSDQASEAIKMLGLSTKDVIGLSTEETFMKIGEAVAKIDDPMRRVALATELFGKQGKDLLPFLEQGKNGMEALRKKAKELGITFSKEDAQAADDFNNSLNTLKSAMTGLTYVLGKLFLPPLEMLAKALTSTFKFVKDLSGSFPWLTTTLVTAGIAIAGLVTVIGIAGKGFLALRAAALAFQISLGPIGWAIAALSVAAGIFIATSSAMNDETNDLSKAFDRADGAIDKTGDSIVEMSAKAKQSAEKIKDLKTEIADLKREADEYELNGKKDIAELFIEQEQKIADMSEDISDKTLEIKKAQRSEDAQDRIQTLNTELQELQAQHSKEQLALQNNKVALLGLDKEYKEAQRRSRLTDFERRLEDMLMEQELEMAKSAEKIRIKELELAELTRIEKEYTAVVEAEEAKRFDIFKANTTRIVDNLNTRMGGQTTQAVSSKLQFRANGGSVSGNEPYVVGEEGPELFIPKSNGQIMSNGMFGANSGTTVNINGGTYLSEDVAQDIGDMIIKRLKFSNAI